MSFQYKNPTQLNFMSAGLSGDFGGSANKISISNSNIGGNSNGFGATTTGTLHIPMSDNTQFYTGVRTDISQGFKGQGGSINNTGFAGFKVTL
jgi:hypothetical protein